MNEAIPILVTVNWYVSQIMELLESSGYVTRHKLMRSVDLGIPQKRERVFITGVRADLSDCYELQSAINVPLRPLKEFLIDRDPEHVLDLNSARGETFVRYLNNRYNHGQYDVKKYMKQPMCVLDTRQSDLRIYNDVVPTLRTGRHGVYYVHNGQLRALSGMESLLLQGFPLPLARMAKAHVSNRNLLSQAGNAMTVPVVDFVAKQVLRAITPVTSQSRQSVPALALAA